MPHLHVVTNLHVVVVVAVAVAVAVVVVVVVVVLVLVVVVVVVVVVAIVEMLWLKLLRCEQGDDGNYGSTAVQDVKGSPEHE